jgi:hypothetical protein
MSSGVKATVVILLTLFLWGSADRAQASLESDLRVSPDPLVFDDTANTDTENKKLTVVNTGNSTHSVLPSTSNSHFRAYGKCTVRPGEACTIDVVFLRSSTETGETGTLTLHDPQNDTKTVNLIGVVDTTVPSCKVKIPRKQVLLETVRRKGKRRKVRHPFKLTVRQNVPGQVGVYTSRRLFKGEKDVPAKAGVRIRRSLRLPRTHERSLIRSIRRGEDGRYKLLVYCRGRGNITMKVTARVILRDRKRDRKFTSPLVAVTKITGRKVLR